MTVGSPWHKLRGDVTVYIIATVRTLRQVATWQQDNLAVCARIALWVLGSTALVVALPVLLAFFLPQHPAP